MHATQQQRRACWPAEEHLAAARGAASRAARVLPAAPGQHLRTQCSRRAASVIQAHARCARQQPRLSLCRAKSGTSDRPQSAVDCIGSAPVELSTRTLSAGTALPTKGAPVVRSRQRLDDMRHMGGGPLLPLSPQQRKFAACTPAQAGVCTASSAAPRAHDTCVPVLREGSSASLTAQLRRCAPPPAPPPLAGACCQACTVSSSAAATCWRAPLAAAGRG